MNALLAATRAVHFGASLLVFGEIVFALVVAGPAWRRMARPGLGPADLERWIRTLLAWGLALSVLSGLVWLALEVPLMSGEPLEEAIAGPTFGVVLRETWFGRVWSLRAILAVVLFACIVSGPRAWASPWSLVTAAAYVAAPAFAGHAAGGRGVEGALRIATDMLHLAAAGAWVGALPGIVLVLRAARRDGGASVLELAARSTRRFSALGILSVSALVASGVANSIVLVGSWRALTDTQYGMLLLTKLAFVAAMLALAAVNLLGLGPRVAARDRGAVQTLARNAVLETAGGIAVVAIVGVLGITVPGEHLGHHRLHSDTSRAIIPNSSPAHPHG